MGCPHNNTHTYAWTHTYTKFANIEIKVQGRKTIFKRELAAVII